MTNTINNVPRELLERAATSIEQRMCIQCEGVPCCMPESLNTLSDIRALLSAQSSAGVDWCKCSMSISMLGDGCRHCQPQEYIDRLGEMLDEERSELSDAQAIIDGLRGENERIRLNIAEYNEAIACYQSERDQQAQRIGELEGLLRHAQKQVPTGSGLHMRIDAALSAVCVAALNIATTSEHSSQPERDPCPTCIKGGICNTPTCGRLLAMPKAY